MNRFLNLFRPMFDLPRVWDLLLDIPKDVTVRSSNEYVHWYDQDLSQWVVGYSTNEDYLTVSADYDGPFTERRYLTRTQGPDTVRV